MNLSGTQSGRFGRVKKNDVHTQALTLAALLCAVMLMSACASSAGGWRQPVKNEALTRADYAACRARAEDSTLELRQSRRPGYGVLDKSDTGVFNPRGDNTMAIVDRSDTTTLYNALVANCMTGKGYTQTTPGETP